MARPFSQDAAIRHDPKALASTLLAAWSSGDLKATRSLLAEDVTFDGPLGSTRGAGAYVEGIKGMVKIVERADQLRAEGTDDVLVVATSQGTTISLAKPVGPATVDSDPATRCLLLWGRRPSDPSMWHSATGAETLRKVRMLLSGY